MTNQAAKPLPQDQDHGRLQTEVAPESNDLDDHSPKLPLNTEVVDTLDPYPLEDVNDDEEDAFEQERRQLFGTQQPSSKSQM